MALVIPQSTRIKLQYKHSVEEREIIEAFANREREFLVDLREEHRTDPPTEWFVAETDNGRKLKICFVNNNGNIYIKSAYVPNQNVIDMYQQKANFI